MIFKLYQLTGWKIFKFKRAPWGEETSHWIDGDWDWFKNYNYRNKVGIN